MNQWDYSFKGDAGRQLEELDKPIKKKFKIIIEELIEMADPINHPKSKALKHNESGFYRIAIDKWRMIYSLDVNQNTIYIYKIGHRNKFYVR